MAQKSFSLDARRGEIHREFDLLYPPPAPRYDPPIEDKRPWIIDYYDDYIVVCDDGEYYKVTYTMNGEKVQLADRSEWKEAKSRQEWIAVKAVGDGEDYTLEILGAPFGGPNNGRDKQGERFTEESNLHQDQYPEIPLVLAHGLDPQTGKPVGKPVYVGKAKYLRSDERGHWWKGVLDKTKTIAQGLWKAAKKGRLGASSGSLSHLIRVRKDGTILEWPVAEMTLADLDSNVTPINTYAIATPMMKAIYREAGLPFPEVGESRPVLPEAQKAVRQVNARNAQQRAKEALLKINRS